MSILDITPPAWMAEAVCASVDPALFFPDAGASTVAARNVCAGCPVRRKCLEWALRIEAEEGRMPGIWGGLTAVQRRELRPTRREKAA